MKILIRQVDEKVFQLHFRNACTFNPFPLLSVYIVMTSRQGLLLIQCFMLPGTTVSNVKKPFDVTKYF